MPDSLHPPLEGEGRPRRASPGAGGVGWGDSLSAPLVLQPRDFGIGCAIKFDVNPFEHRRKIAGNLGIPKPHDPISLFLKPKLSLAIILCNIVAVVMPTVQFDNEPFGWTEKVDDVWTDRRLSSEMRAFYREFSQGAPQYTFVRRRVGPQFLRGCASDRR